MTKQISRWPTPAYRRRRSLKAERRAERDRRTAAVPALSPVVRGINFAARLLADWLANAKPQAAPIRLKADPFKGKVRIAAQSSLRKLMRASRRGKIPAERVVIIEAAEKSATKRPH